MARKCLFLCNGEAASFADVIGAVIMYIEGASAADMNLGQTHI
jgi:hypothetical protein